MALHGHRYPFMLEREKKRKKKKKEGKGRNYVKLDLDEKLPRACAFFIHLLGAFGR